MDNIAVKSGARNSKSDQEHIQSAHDSMAALGATCAPADAAKSLNAVEIKSITDTAFTIKGRAVVFGGQDVTADYFDAETDYWLDKMGSQKVVLYEHGLTSELKSTVFGLASLSADDEGLFFEAEIDRSQKYAGAILKLAEAGRLGVSTGAVAHLVRRDTIKSGRRHVSSWPIAELTLTPEPCEPRTIGVGVLKSLAAVSPELAASLKGVYLDAPEGSYEDLISDLNEAVSGLYPKTYNPIYATFPDYCLVVVTEFELGEAGEQTIYKIPYTVGPDGEPVIGTPEEVPHPFEPPAIEAAETETLGAKSVSLTTPATNTKTATSATTLTIGAMKGAPPAHSISAVERDEAEARLALLRLAS